MLLSRLKGFLPLFNRSREEAKQVQKKWFTENKMEGKELGRMLDASRESTLMKSMAPQTAPA